VRVSNGTLLTVADISMVVSLVLDNVTVAAGSYRGVLLGAIVGVAVSVTCCAVLVMRGGWIRWVAIVSALPCLFVVWDFTRRAPYVFT
jgi:multisubunit Na+/H+ antiporter MnhE subunit